MILVSACLLGVNCKYNGQNNYNEKVIDFIKDKEYIKVCPEQLGGLPTPRIPSERLNDKVINKKGIDVTDNFKKGAEKVLEMINNKKIDLAILKSKSPSCGKGKIYDGNFNGTLIDGNGVLTDLLIKKGIKVITENDL